MTLSYITSLPFRFALSLQTKFFFHRFCANGNTMKEETERHTLLVRGDSGRRVISLAAAIRVASREKPKKKQNLTRGPAGMLQAISCLNIIKACMYSTGACCCFYGSKTCFVFFFPLFALFFLDIIYNSKGVLTWKMSLRPFRLPSLFRFCFVFCNLLVIFILLIRVSIMYW